MKPTKDLTGKQFGRWVVLRYASMDERSRKKWLCQCSCGTKRTVREDILKNGQSRSCGCLAKEVSSQCNRGAKNFNWKGGRTVHNGYVLIRKSDHPRVHAGYVAEHVVVLEKKLGRNLLSIEHAHHIDGNRKNNDPENLEAVTRSEHARRHNLGRKTYWSKLSEDQVRTIKASKGKTQTALAREYGVSQSTISLILLGKSWRRCA